MGSGESPIFGQDGSSTQVTFEVHIVQGQHVGVFAIRSIFTVDDVVGETSRIRAVVFVRHTGLPS